MFRIFFKIYQKSVATFAIVCFVTSLNTLPPEALAQPLNLETSSLSREITLGGRDLSVSFVPLGIPPELASIEEVFIPDPKKARSTPLIHIQSVHAHAETQKKIYGVLKFLDEKYGIGSLFIEGAAEMLDPNYFRFFDENRLNVRVAEKLLEKGELTGAELFLIESEKEIPAYGIEDISLYRDNLTTFQTVMLHRPMTTRFIENTRGHLDRLETFLLQPEARRLLRSNESFDAGEMQLLSYALELERKTKQILNADLRHFESQFEWPQMLRFLRLQEIESSLDPEKIQADRQNLIGYLRGMGVDSELVDSFEQMSFTPYQSGMVYDPGFRPSDLPRYLAERLLLATHEKGFTFDRYPAFTRYLEAAILQSELEAGRLFDELEKLFETMVRSASKREEEWTLVELVQKDRLFNRLFDLGLTPKDYGKIRLENQTPRPLVRFLMNIESLEEKASLIHRPSSFSLSGKGERVIPDNIEEFESVYDNAVLFYELAKRREERMVDKILEVIAKNPDGDASSVIADSTTARHPEEARRADEGSRDPSAASRLQDDEMRAPRNDNSSRDTRHASPVTILITGGFHTEGLSHAFRKNQVPYTILTPRITEKISTEAYVSMLLGEKKTTFDTQYLEPAIKAISGAVRLKMTSRKEIWREIRTVLESLIEVALDEKQPAERTVNDINKSLYAQNRRFVIQLAKSGKTAMIWDKTAGDYLKDSTGKYPIVIPMDTVRVEFEVLAARSVKLTAKEILKEFGFPPPPGSSGESVSSTVRNSRDQGQAPQGATSLQSLQALSLPLSSSNPPSLAAKTANRGKIVTRPAEERQALPWEKTLQTRRRNDQPEGVSSSPSAFSLQRPVDSAQTLLISHVPHGIPTLAGDLLYVNHKFKENEISRAEARSQFPDPRLVDHLFKAEADKLISEKRPAELFEILEKNYQDEPMDAVQIKERNRARAIHVLWRIDSFSLGDVITRAPGQLTGEEAFDAGYAVFGQVYRKIIGLLGKDFIEKTHLASYVPPKEIAWQNVPDEFRELKKLRIQAIEILYELDGSLSSYYQYNYQMEFRWKDGKGEFRSQEDILNYLKPILERLNRWQKEGEARKGFGYNEGAVLKAISRLHSLISLMSRAEGRGWNLFDLRRKVAALLGRGVYKIEALYNYLDEKIIYGFKKKSESELKWTPEFFNDSVFLISFSFRQLLSIPLKLLYVFVMTPMIILWFLVSPFRALHWNLGELSRQSLKWLGFDVVKKLRKWRLMPGFIDRGRLRLFLDDLESTDPFFRDLQLVQLKSFVPQLSDDFIRRHPDLMKRLLLALSQNLSDKNIAIAVSYSLATLGNLVPRLPQEFLKENSEVTGDLLDRILHILPDDLQEFYLISPAIMWQKATAITATSMNIAGNVIGTHDWDPALKVLATLIHSDPSLREKLKPHRLKIERLLSQRLGIIQAIEAWDGQRPLETIVTLGGKVRAGTIFKETFPSGTGDPGELARWIIENRTPGTNVEDVQISVGWHTGDLLPKQEDRGRLIALALLISSSDHVGPLKPRPTRDGDAAFGPFILGPVLQKIEPGQDQSDREDHVVALSHDMKEENLVRFLHQLQLLHLGLFLKNALDTHRFFFPGETPHWAEDPRIQAAIREYDKFEENFMALLDRYDRHRNPETLAKELLQRYPERAKEIKAALGKYSLNDALSDDIQWLAPLEADEEVRDALWDALFPRLQSVQGVIFNAQAHPENPELTIGKSFVNEVRSLMFEAASRIEQALRQDSEAEKEERAETRRFRVAPQAHPVEVPKEDPISIPVKPEYPAEPSPAQPEPEKIPVTEPAEPAEPAEVPAEPAEEPDAVPAGFDLKLTARAEGRKWLAFALTLVIGMGVGIETYLFYGGLQVYKQGGYQKVYEAIANHTLKAVSALIGSFFVVGLLKGFRRGEKQNPLQFGLMELFAITLAIALFITGMKEFFSAFHLAPHTRVIHDLTQRGKGPISVETIPSVVSNWPVSYGSLVFFITAFIIGFFSGSWLTSKKSLDKESEPAARAEEREVFATILWNSEMINHLIRYGSTAALALVSVGLAQLIRLAIRNRDGGTRKTARIWRANVESELSQRSKLNAEVRQREKIEPGKFQFSLSGMFTLMTGVAVGLLLDQLYPFFRSFTHDDQSLVGMGTSGDTTTGLMAPSLRTSPYERYHRFLAALMAGVALTFWIRFSRSDIDRMYRRAKGMLTQAREPRFSYDNAVRAAKIFISAFHQIQSQSDHPLQGRLEAPSQINEWDNTTVRIDGKEILRLEATVIVTRYLRDKYHLNEKIVLGFSKDGKTVYLKLEGKIYSLNEAGNFQEAKDTNVLPRAETRMASSGEEDRKPGARWYQFQFSVRTLFVIMTLAVLVAAAISYRNLFLERQKFAEGQISLYYASEDQEMPEILYEDLRYRGYAIAKLEYDLINHSDIETRVKAVDGLIELQGRGAIRFLNERLLEETESRLLGYISDQLVSEKLGLITEKRTRDAMRVAETFLQAMDRKIADQTLTGPGGKPISGLSLFHETLNRNLVELANRNPNIQLFLISQLTERIQNRTSPQLAGEVMALGNIVKMEMDMRVEIYRQAVEVLIQVAGLEGKEHWDASTSAIRSLGELAGGGDGSRTMIDALLKILNSNDEMKRFEAVKALRNFPLNPQDIQSLAKKFPGEKDFIRETIVEALAEQTNIFAFRDPESPAALRKAFEEFLKTPDLGEDLRMKIKEAMQGLQKMDDLRKLEGESKLEGLKPRAENRLKRRVVLITMVGIAALLLAAPLILSLFRGAAPPATAPPVEPVMSYDEIHKRIGEIPTEARRGIEFRLNKTIGFEGKEEWEFSAINREGNYQQFTNVTGLTAHKDDVYIRALKETDNYKPAYYLITSRTPIQEIAEEKVPEAVKALLSQGGGTAQAFPTVNELQFLAKGLKNPEKVVRKIEVPFFDLANEPASKKLKVLGEFIQTKYPAHKVLAAGWLDGAGEVIVLLHSGKENNWDMRLLVGNETFFQELEIQHIINARNLSEYDFSLLNNKVRIEAIPKGLLANGFFVNGKEIETFMGRDLSPPAKIESVMSYGEIDKRVDQIARKDRPGISFGLNRAVTFEGKQEGEFWIRNEKIKKVFTNVTGFTAHEGKVYIRTLEEHDSYRPSYYLITRAGDMNEVSEENIPAEVKNLLGQGGGSAKAVGPVKRFPFQVKGLNRYEAAIREIERPGIDLANKTASEKLNLIAQFVQKKYSSHAVSAAGWLEGTNEAVIVLEPGEDKARQDFYNNFRLVVGNENYLQELKVDYAERTRDLSSGHVFLSKNKIQIERVPNSFEVIGFSINDKKTETYLGPLSVARAEGRAEQDITPDLVRKVLRELFEKNVGTPLDIQDYLRGEDTPQAGAVKEVFKNNGLEGAQARELAASMIPTLQKLSTVGWNVFLFLVLGAACAIAFLLSLFMALGIGGLEPGAEAIPNAIPGLLGLGVIFGALAALVFPWKYMLRTYRSGRSSKIQPRAEMRLLEPLAFFLAHPEAVSPVFNALTYYVMRWVAKFSARAEERAEGRGVYYDPASRHLFKVGRGGDNTTTLEDLGPRRSVWWIFVIGAAAGVILYLWRRNFAAEKPPDENAPKALLQHLQTLASLLREFASTPVAIHSTPTNSPVPLAITAGRAETRALEFLAFFLAHPEAVSTVFNALTYYVMSRMPRPFRRAEVRTSKQEDTSGERVSLGSGQFPTKQVQSPLQSVTLWLRSFNLPPLFHRWPEVGPNKLQPRILPQPSNATKEKSLKRGRLPPFQQATPPLRFEKTSQAISASPWLGIYFFSLSQIELYKKIKSESTQFRPTRAEGRTAYGQDISGPVNKIVELQNGLNNRSISIPDGIRKIRELIGMVEARTEQDSGTYQYHSLNRYSGLTMAATYLVQWPVHWYEMDFAEITAAENLPEEFRQHVPEIRDLIREVRDKIAEMRDEIRRDQARLQVDENFVEYAVQTIKRLDEVLMNLDKIFRAETRATLEFEISRKADPRRLGELFINQSLSALPVIIGEDTLRNLQRLDPDLSVSENYTAEAVFNQGPLRSDWPHFIGFLITSGETQTLILSQELRLDLSDNSAIAAVKKAFQLPESAIIRTSPLIPVQWMKSGVRDAIRIDIRDSSTGGRAETRSVIKAEEKNLAGGLTPREVVEEMVTGGAMGKLDLENGTAVVGRMARTSPVRRGTRRNRVIVPQALPVTSLPLATLEGPLFGVPPSAFSVVRDYLALFPHLDGAPEQRLQAIVGAAKIHKRKDPTARTGEVLNPLFYIPERYGTAGRKTLEDALLAVGQTIVDQGIDLPSKGHEILLRKDTFNPTNQPGALLHKGKQVAGARVAIFNHRPTLEEFYAEILSALPNKNVFMEIALTPDVEISKAGLEGLREAASQLIPDKDRIVINHSQSWPVFFQKTLARAADRLYLRMALATSRKGKGFVLPGRDSFLDSHFVISAPDDLWKNSAEARQALANTQGRKILYVLDSNENRYLPKRMAASTLLTKLSQDLLRQADQRQQFQSVQPGVLRLDGNSLTEDWISRAEAAMAAVKKITSAA